MNKKLPAILKIIIPLILLFPGKLHAQQYATSQTNGVTGICLLCGVTNPDNPVNHTSLTDYSTFAITVGLLGVSVHQTLIFPSPANGGCDSLVIGIGNPNGLLSVNLLASVTIQTFNGTIANSDSAVVNSSNLRLLGGNRGEIVLKPTRAFDRVNIKLNSSVAGLLTGLNLYYAYRFPAIPAPVAADSIVICSGDSAVLTATGVTGAVIRWYNAAGGGTLLHTGNVFRVKPGTNTTYYAEALLNGCTSLRKAVRVIVNPRPANPVYTVPQGFICGSAQLQVSNYSSGINYRVNIHFMPFAAPALDTAYTVVNSNVITIPPFVFGGGAVAVIGVQAIDAITGCRSDTVKSNVVYGASARIPTVNADSITICKGDTASFTASNPVVNTVIFRWYDAPTGGNLLFTGPTFKTSPPQTTTYYVSAAFDCEFPVRKAVTVIVRKPPVPQFNVPQGVVCGSTFIKISNHQNGFSYRVRKTHLYFGNVMADTTFLVNNKDSIGLPGLVTFFSTVVNLAVQARDPASGCWSDTVRGTYIQGSSVALPNTNFDSVTICKGADTTLIANVPGFASAIIYWYDAPAGGNLLYTGNAFNVSPTVNTVYYVTAGGYCIFPERKPVKVKVVDCPLMKISATAHPDRPSEAGKLMIYPNPTTGIISFSNYKDVNGGLLIIRDLNGREVQRTIINHNTLQLKPQLPGGYYHMQVIIDKQKIFKGSFILNR